jgi:hypothetical protein
MNERNRFVDWVGETVMVNMTHGGAPVGVLEEVNDWGIVVRSDQDIWWQPIQEPDEEGYVQTKQVVREVSEFYPWPMVVSVRVLELDEAAARGY